MRRGRAIFAGACAALLYGLATPWALRPWFLADDLLPHAPGPIGTMADADLYLNIWILSWIAHAALNAPGALLHGNIFHPATLTIAGSENMLAHLPLTAPVLAVTGSALALLKAYVLETFVLSGIAMYLYVWHHTRSPVAALVAGAAYTFTPFRVRTIPQPQYLGIQFLPLALLSIDLWLERRRIGWLAALAGAIALQALACVYLGFFAIVLAPVYAAVRSLRFPPRRLAALVGAALAIAAGACALAPLAYAYLQARDAGMIPEWQVEWIRHFSWRPVDYLTMGFVERAGAVTLLLVGLDLVSRAGRRRRETSVRSESPVPALWSMAAAGIVLSAGPTLALPAGFELPLPYRLLHAIVPGFSSIRVPLRFSLAVAGAMAALAGLAVARATRSLDPPVRWAIGVALVLACVLSAAPRPSAVMPALLDDNLPEAYRWLGAQEKRGPLLEIPGTTVGDGDPIGNMRSGRYMVASTAHWLPLVNGYTAYPPPASGLLAAMIRDLPNATALQALVDATHVRWLLVHHDLLTGDEAARWPDTDLDGLERVARFGPDELFAVTLEPKRPWHDVIARSSPSEASLEGLSRAPLADRCRLGRIVSAEVPERMMPIPLPRRVPLRIANDSPCPWPAAGVRPRGLVGFDYRWTSPSGVPQSLGPFSQLVHDVPAGSQRDESIMVLPPSGELGPWQLEIRVVQHGSEEPIATSRVTVELRAPKT
jgi:hypothetical protein